MYPLYLYKFITDKILSVNVDEDMASRDWIWPLEIGSVESDNTVLHYEWEDQSVEVIIFFHTVPIWPHGCTVSALKSQCVGVSKCCAG